MMFELRQAYRGLIRRPAYAAATIGTLALVIGVNAALFAAINATLFRPIPLKSGDRTVQIYLMPPGLSDPKFRNPLHAIDLVRFRERARTLTHIAAFTTVDRVLSFGGGEPAVINTAAVSAEIFRVAVDTPLLGRAFTEEEVRVAAFAEYGERCVEVAFGGVEVAQRIVETPAPVVDVVVKARRIEVFLGGLRKAQREAANAGFRGGDHVDRPVDDRCERVGIASHLCQQIEQRRDSR